MAIKFGINNTAPVLFKTRKGIFVEVPRRLLQTFKEIFMDECYMDGLELHVPDNSTVIDIGANAGFFTLFAVNTGFLVPLDLEGAGKCKEAEQCSVWAEISAPEVAYNK